MKTYLVTGAAGFIGANFIKHMLAKYDDIKIVVLDLLTYAGNLGTIAENIDGVRCEFVKGDFCDRALADQLFEKYNFDYVVNFAAESHVDRSIENPQLFLQTHKTYWTPHEKHGLPVRPRQVIRYGVKVYVSIKSLPMRSMEALVPKGISTRPRL